MLRSHGRLEQIAGVAALVLLAVGCMLVLKPFLSSLLWAAILTFSTWPLYTRLLTRLNGRRGLAALLMTLLLAGAFVVPLLLVGTSLTDDAGELFDLARDTLRNGLPGPPGWVATLPLVGPYIAAYWLEVAQNTGRLAEVMQPFVAPLRTAAVAAGLAIGGAVLEVSLSVLASYFFYRDGLTAVRYLEGIGQRLFGERALPLIEVAEGTIRSVVYGIIGTALVQGALATVGYLVVGIPSAYFLGFVTFLLALFPMGPPLVWLPVTVWLFYNGWLAAGVFMGLWGAFAISGVDNFLRPYLISRGSNLSFLLVFLGVVGGALAFGFLGIFLGPTLLAVGFTVIREWSTVETASTGSAAEAPRPAVPERETAR